MRSQHFRGNVFVANLPPEFTDDQLAEAFDSFGMVLSAFIARDPATGKRLRYGFVDIATERAAKLAVESMNGAAIDGYNLDVRISERPIAGRKPPRATPGPQRSPQKMPARLDSPGEDAAGGFSPRPQPRRQPSFQVERRPLPRRP
jgi:RNA recognition motif-containing protein